MCVTQMKNNIFVNVLLIKYVVCLCVFERH